MLQNRWWLSIATLASLMCWPMTASLLAGEFREPDKQGKAEVTADEVIEGDLYIAGKDVVIDGTIKGDLVVAGQNVIINGTVEGNVFAAGQSVTVKGTVQGDLTAAGQGILIEGKVNDDARVAAEVFKLAKTGYIGGDLAAAGMSLECEKESNVAADAMLAGMQLLSAGKIGKNVWAGLLNCQLDGEVGGNTSLYSRSDGQPLQPQMFQQLPPGFTPPTVSGGLNIGQDAKIAGKLTYTSVREANIANPAAITGGVEHVAVVPQQAAAVPQAPPTIQGMVFARLKMLAAVALVGLATVLILPRWTNEMAANLRQPVRLFFSVIGGPVGVFGFIVLLIVILVVMFVAMGLFGFVGLDNMVGISFGLGMFGGISLAGLLWFAFWFLAPTIVSVFVGRLIGRSQTFPTIAAFLIGLVIVGILLSIPHAGFWIGLVVSLLGLGAFCVWLVAGAPEEPVRATAVAK